MRRRSARSQPIRVMRTRQSATQTLWASTIARPGMKASTPATIDQRAAVEEFAPPWCGKPSRLSRMPMPMISSVGPMSLARKSEVCMVSCPFAGMTRIRFKGSPRTPAVSQPHIGTPLGTALM